ncbi:MAG: MFS transporter [Pseudomonadota bacterium]|nr:MFS transporter [Pseudomonadota bacterium]
MKKNTQITAFTPLKRGVFRRLWIANLVSNTGTWMHDVGAGWLMTSLAPDPFMVSLVQVSVLLPGFLLTLPAGALADIVDRRFYLLTAILWMTLMAGGLGLITISGIVTPWSLVALTFGLGIGTAMMMPTFSALIPDLVPRKELTAAVTLSSISQNITRAIGPAVAGGVIALVGPGPVFLLNAISFTAIFIVIYQYQSKQPRSTLPSERFIGALQTGFRFFRQSPALQTVTIRSVAFFIMMGGLFAFLPLIVREEVGAGPQIYGLLLASLGLGAVTLGLTLPRFRTQFSSDTILMAGTIIGALALLGLAYIRSTVLLVPIMFVAGGSWISGVSTLQVSTQLSLPAWIRARGISIFMLSFLGSMALGAASWGLLASATSTTMALSVAVVFGLLLGLAASRWKLSDYAEIDYSTAQPSDEPTSSLSLTSHDGPVMLNVEYLIDPADRKAFEEAMRDVRRMRLRNGAVAWGLFQDADNEHRFIETFIDPTWLTHLRQQERVTVEDMEFKQVAEAFHRSTNPPKTSHFIARGAPKRRHYRFRM